MPATHGSEPPSTAGRTLWALVGLSTLVAFAAAAWAVRPIEAGSVGFDTAASVLYARQIATGVHLEVPVGTTPKPLLTLVDGLLYGATADWRAIAWLTILVEAVAVGLATALAGRLAGPVAAGFVAGALVGLPALLADVGRAYALSFGLACWAAAGLAVTGQRPRLWLASLFLALGTTARLETVLIAAAGVAVAGGAAALRWFRQRRAASPGSLEGPLRQAAFVALGGFLGLAAMATHDLLLTGDPTYWLSVPARATGSLEVAPPGHWILVAGGELVALGIAAPLAPLGLASRVWRRGPGVLIGVLGLGLGSVALMVGLSLRQIWVSVRYGDPLLLAAVLLAGVGAAALRLPTRSLTFLVGRWLGRLPVGLRVAVAFGIGAVVAVAGSPTFAPLDRPTRAAILRDRTVAAHLDRALPVIEEALLALPRAREPTQSSIEEPVWDPVVLVTGPLLGPRTAVSLDLPASRVGTLSSAPRATDLRPGRIVYHDRAAVRDPTAYRWLELAVPAPIAPLAGVWAEPLLSDPSAGVWVLRLSARPGG